MALPMPVERETQGGSGNFIVLRRGRNLQHFGSAAGTLQSDPRTDWVVYVSQSSRVVEPSPPPPESRVAVLVDGVFRAADFLGLSDSQLEKVVGIAKEELLQSKHKGDTFKDGSMPFERAVLLVRAFRSLNVIADGDEKFARAWMEAEDSALGGRPIDLIMEVEGLIDVAACLDARETHS